MTHGHDAVDHLRIDPRLGDDELQRFPDALAGEVVESSEPAGAAGVRPPHSWRVLTG